jgi:hypothetical protein
VESGVDLIRWAIAAVLFGGASLAASADGGAIATIVEGKSSVIRGLERFDIDEGLRMAPHDLVHTGVDAFVKIELEDGAVVELGPSTLARYDVPGHDAAGCPALYLLSGWMKVINGKAEGERKLALCAPGMMVSDVSFAVVLQSEGGSASLYIEDGNARVSDRRNAAAQTYVLQHGNYLVMAPDQPLAPLEHPVSAFYGAVPRLFRDSLPSRYGRYSDKAAPAPRNGAAFAYAEVEPWIDAEPAIRRQCVELWRDKAANDPAFRAALERDLRRHPEWEAVLHAGRKSAAAGPHPPEFAAR